MRSISASAIRCRLDIPFVDETGRQVTLGDYFGKRPVVLALVYYECPMLCTQVLNGLVSALGVLNFDAGREFDVVAVSFNPKEGPGLASQKKASYVERYGRPQTAGGWHFLTGSQESITRLTEAVGFKYQYDQKIGQFAHGAAIEVLTPKGTIAKYFYGIEYSPRDLRLGLIEASDERIGSRRRRCAALLLPLRPVDRQVRCVRPRDRSCWRRRHRARVRRIPDGQPAPGCCARRGGQPRPGAAVPWSPNLTMFTNLPFFPQQASAQAAQVDAIYFFMVAVTAFFSLLIAVLVVVFAVKYRRKNDDEVGVAIHGSLALELLWTFIPLGIAMVMFAWGAKVFFDLYRPPAGAMEIFVVGKQWMWKAQHADGQREINELHVPIGRPVKLVMGSEDVIHSYYIPAFRVKADVIPGRYNSLWFTATKPGRYHLFCAEYCGTKHSGMIGWITAMEPADYQAWLAGGPADGVADRGRREALSGSRVRHLPHAGAAGARARARRALFGKAIQLQGGGTATVRRSVPARVDREPAGEDRRRLPADHADVPGAGDRGAAAAAHRLRARARPAGAAAGRDAAGIVGWIQRIIWKP